MNVDKLKQNKFNDDQFYAVIFKDLLRVNFSDLHCSCDSPCQSLFKADSTCKEIIDYSLVDEIRVVILTEYQVTLVDQFNF